MKPTKIDLWKCLLLSGCLCLSGHVIPASSLDDDDEDIAENQIVEVSPVVDQSATEETPQLNNNTSGKDIIVAAQTVPVLPDGPLKELQNRLKPYSENSDKSIKYQAAKAQMWLIYGAN